MKTFAVIFVSVLISSMSMAQAHFEAVTLEAHMLKVNENWKGHDLSDELIAFASDEDRIQRHLFEVHRLLLESDKQDLSSDALSSRIQLLQDLKQYAENRNFPKNSRHDYTIPYFIDYSNTPCAVANLMLAANDESIAHGLQADYNFDYLKSMPQPLLTAWAEQRGFETEELALIQPQYGPTYSDTRWLESDIQVNGHVNEAKYDEDESQLCIAGQFDTLGYTCFACFKDGMTSSPFSDLNGEAFDFHKVGADWIVAGDFRSKGGLLYNNGTRYTSLDLGRSYSSHAIVGDDGQVYFDAYFEGNDSTIVYAMSTSTFSARPMIGIKGRVNDLAMYDDMLAIGGAFRMAYTDSSTLACNNFVVWEDNALKTKNSTFNGHINTFEVVDGLLYIGGDCRTDSTDTTTCLATMNTSGQWQAELDENMRYGNLMYGLTSFLDVLDLHVYRDTLFVAGDLSGNSGNGLFYLHEDDILMGITWFNAPVHALAQNTEGDLVAGGAFTTYTHGATDNAPPWQTSTLPLRYLAHKADELTGINDYSSIGLELYPNPSHEVLNIKTDDQLEEVLIYDMSGRVVQSSIEVGNSHQLDVSNLKNGTYIAQIKAEDDVLRRFEFVVHHP